MAATNFTTIFTANTTANMTDNLTYNMTANMTAAPDSITVPAVDRAFHIAVFGGIISAIFCFGSLRALAFFTVALRSSKSLHNTMFASVLRSNQRFFDNNPVGKSRCSK